MLDLRVAALDEELVGHAHLAGREPAVDREHGAAHEGRLVRGQEQHGGGHLSGVPMRPSGYQRASRSRRSGSRASRSSQAAVRIEPGATELARTPCRP